MRKGQVDHTNKIFGRLTVIEYDKSITKWICQCICGTIKKVRSGDLLSGDIKSCGCLRNEIIRKMRTPDIAGTKFGKLEVIKYTEMRGINSYWECLCECGKTKNIRYGHLTSGNIQSCGCFGLSLRTTHGKSRDKDYLSYLRNIDPSRKARSNISICIGKYLKRNNHNKKGKTFDHLPYTPKQLKEHLESLWEPWMNWDNYGGRMNDPRKTWHIDHIIPHCNFNYTSLNDDAFLACWALNNLRPLEKHLNRKKWWYNNFQDE